jgi:hypothetical protein
MRPEQSAADDVAEDQGLAETPGDEAEERRRDDAEADGAEDVGVCHLRG